MVVGKGFVGIPQRGIKRREVETSGAERRDLLRTGTLTRGLIQTGNALCLTLLL